MKYKRSPITIQVAIFDFTSIPGFVIKKKSSRGPIHGASERQVMFFKANEMLTKAIQGKRESHPTIVARWYAQERYHDSLAKNNIGDKDVVLFDRIALERHDYTATRAERLQNTKRWIPRLSADGHQKPLRQRPTFAVASKQCLEMQGAQLVETQQSLRPIRPEQKDEQEILTQPPLAEVQANEERQGNLVQEYEQRFEKLSEDRKFSRLCSEAGLRLVGIGHFFYLPSPRGQRKSIFLPRITLPRDQGGKSYRRADPKQCTIWPSLGHKSLRSIRKIQY